MKQYFVPILSLIATATIAGSSQALAASVDPQTRQTANALIQEAKGLLPPGFLERIGTEYSITLDPTLAVLGRATDHEIILGKPFLAISNPQYLDLSLSDSRISNALFGENGDTPQTHHKTVHQFLLATVVHEFAHLYDFNAAPLADEAKSRSYCNALDRFALSEQPWCDLYRGKKYALSDSNEFLDLIQWYSAQTLAQKSRSNYLDSRSPDPYEWTSPVEALAVNFEYFILDPDYKCRRPSHYAFYRKAFGFDPSSSISCTFPSDVIENDFSALSESIITLDPSRLYSVDYLLAGPAPQFMSRFGHSMIRFVFCRAGEPVGPNCNVDTESSFVIGFSALIDGYKLDSMKGLNGGYPAVPTFYSLSQIIEEYNDQEFRDLMSYPLNLSTEEKQSVLKAAIEAHWTYQGKYYFISSNCATEALNLLKTALPGRSDIQGIAATVPTDLRDQLVLGKLVGQPDQDPHHGQIFKSKKPYFDRAVQAIKTLDSNVDSLDDFSKMPIQEKTSLTKKVVQARKTADLAYLYMLLNYDYNNKKDILFAKYIDELSDGKGSAQEQAQFKSVSADISSRLRIFDTPSLLITDSSYGLPNSQELAALRNSSFWSDVQQTITAGNQLQSTVMNSHLSEAREVNASFGLLNSVAQAIQSN